MRDYFNESASTRFIFPIDGDYVTERDGIATEAGVELTVAVASDKGCRLTVNGADAAEKNGIYTAAIKVGAGCTHLFAKNLTNGAEASVRICYQPSAVGKYRISSDDNILFLADLTKNADRYASIFENPYLAVYKKAHDLYGAKVHLNLFYAFDRAAAECFSAERADFDLSMMTDKFKAEWEKNSDWLKLSFHSRTEFPDAPYKSAKPEAIIADFLDVRREVLRFAGEGSFSGDVTTVHFGEATPQCVAALRDLGHKALTGYFEMDEQGLPLVAYYAPVPLINHIGERDFWRDTEMKITFGRIDRVTNIDSLERVMEDMHKIIAHPHRSGFVSIMIHEQYFYEDYINHLSDFEARVLEPARLLFERGYEGSFVKEVLLCEDW